MLMAISSMRHTKKDLLSSNTLRQENNTVPHQIATSVKMPSITISTPSSPATTIMVTSFHADVIPKPNATLSPYNGEEVYIHWANRDQYYVKSGEHFSTYRFKSQGVTVTFDLRDVDIEKDNVKGMKRFFVPLSTEITYKIRNQ